MTAKTSLTMPQQLARLVSDPEAERWPAKNRRWDCN
jgi:hypothetical protein